MQFIGREYELSALKAELERASPSLVIVHGRRRIGKTRLLLEAMKDRTGVYFQAARVMAGLNLDAFKAAISASIGPSLVLDGIATWEGVLHHLADHAAAAAAGLTVVIDEFLRLTAEDKALPSIVQRFWDTGAPAHGNLKLVLCGSSSDQMKELLAGRNPLYGRQTMALPVKQLPLRDAARFLPRYGAEEKVMAYAIFGGVPYYLRACDPDASLRDNLAALLFQDTGALFDEATILLQSEFRDPATYSSILAAMASGRQITSTIAGRLGVEAKAVTPYIAKLDRLGLVDVSRSLDADERARDLRCAIKDPLTSFWHAFVLPNLSAINSGRGDAVCDLVMESGLFGYMTKAFRQICREHAALHVQEELGIPAQQVGQVWGRADFDIDVAGRLVDASTHFFGKCEWHPRPTAPVVVNQMKRRSKATSYGAGEKRTQFLFFSRKGFEGGVVKAAEKDASLHLIDLEQLVYPPNIRK